MLVFQVGNYLSQTADAPVMGSIHHKVIGGCHALPHDCRRPVDLSLVLAVFAGWLVGALQLPLLLLCLVLVREQGTVFSLAMAWHAGPPAELHQSPSPDVHR
jgi:hypothetical protein